MRLKQIKLAGFKSFVDPTTVPFPGNMTAIVGPNGCGKSNTIDAVRWVLGESSAKNLRGDAMTDVIFNGSSGRKPVSQASVELVFENHQGRIGGNYANFNEISVKRVVTRDAVSTYLLNGSKCRKRDITDLFLGTGLGPRSYAIIEQGMISRLIESKPQELRIFIEEAAGISKYKERRRETENRLKHTRENMERLGDVREELGKQLEKLQRQAAAARRFKELKAKERQLKSELYGIRWYQLNEQLNRCEKEQAEQETALEQFNAQQQGKETHLVKLQTEHAAKKADQEQCQRKLFQLTTDITRLEQQMMASRQHKARVEDELAQLAIKQEQLAELIATESEQLDVTQAELEALEESGLMLNEQLEQSQLSLDEAEQALADWQQRWQASEQASANVRQQQAIAQNKQTHLGQLEQQQRQRLTQVSDELTELDESELTLELNQLAEALALQSEQLAEQQLITEQAKSELAEQQQAMSSAEQNIHQSQLKQAGWQAQRDAIQSQLSNLEQAEALPEGRHHLYQQLNVAEDWAVAVERVLGSFSRSFVSESLTSQDQGAAGRVSLLSENTDASETQDALFQQNELLAKVSGPAKSALAPLLWGVECADDDESAWARQPSLQMGQSVIAPSGLWLGVNWQAPSQQSSDGPLRLQQQSQQLDAQLMEIEALMAEQRTAVEACAQQVAQVQQSHQLAVQACQKMEAELAQVRQQRHFAEQKLTEKRHRRERVQQEQEMLKEQLAEHEAERELLSEQLLMLEEQLADESESYALESEKESLEQIRQQRQQQFTQFQQQLQQVAVRQEGLKAQLNALVSAKQRTQVDLDAVQKRQLVLKEELTQDHTPELEQAEQLELLLSERLELNAELSLLTDAISELEQQTRDMEMGQRDVLQHLEKQRAKISDLKLEAEGFRVRARSVLETLQEMNVNLKQVLSELPAEYSEADWQEQLDKTSQAISRLGAINLAAIEEYEQQAERKAYLDSQNEDLESAVDTLETAIRKIDRETRQRFRQTYDQVNEDLQRLFPKVFGGGSAQLALTDDDLLETGVTIMAQPPGKKNSTIHLLSGGEKALTALSLVFAIFRLNPAPFCMLDEVDAPLDDANVGRFCNLVKEMSETVQFIFISHNKVSMEMASHLTGVTMQEPGVSRLVAVDVEQAVALAELG
ncbi:chromosome segregation protein SMC [Corallincola platygyrae]|uniref:Chromosome partition protein Smc n=1 Tax=Corallincola platygyrae TaxID=1193278 RepID=A0ABW4XVT2_9GAMM